MHIFLPPTLAPGSKMSSSHWPRHSPDFCQYKSAKFWSSVYNHTEGSYTEGSLKQLFGLLITRSGAEGDFPFSSSDPLVHSSLEVFQLHCNNHPGAESPEPRVKRAFLSPSSMDFPLQCLCALFCLLFTFVFTSLH